MEYKTAKELENLISECINDYGEIIEQDFEVLIEWIDGRFTEKGIIKKSKNKEE